MKRLGSLSVFCLVCLSSTGSLAQPPNAAQREELRRKADEARERNAREREEIQRNFAPSGPPSQSALKTVDAVQVCRATIAALMGRPVEIVNVINEVGGIVHLSYSRPSDQSVWRNRCKVAGSSVMWATDLGRWRDHPLDEKITFRVAGSDLVIKQQFSDGSSSEKAFPIAAL